MLFEYLKENYKDGEPIFLDDIHIEGMRRDNFRQQIKTLADAGKIALTIYYHFFNFHLYLFIVKKKNRANIVFTMPLCKSQTFSMCYIHYTVLNQLSTTNFRKSGF